MKGSVGYTCWLLGDGEMYSDYIWMLLRGASGSVALHHTTLLLWHLHSFICLLFSLSRHLSFPAAPPTRSALHPFLLLLSSISIWKQSCSLCFLVHSSSSVTHVSSPTLFCPLPSSEDGWEAAAAAITVFFEVSYYNKADRELSCLPNHITAQQSCLHLAGSPAAALMVRVQAKLSGLDRRDRDTCCPVEVTEWTGHV